MDSICDTCWNKHKQRIIKDLQINKEPYFIYGEDAAEFSKRHGGGIQVGKNTNGAFLYREIPEKYEESGVICIYARSIGTLAHELCHARQYQEGSKWFNSGLLLKLRYKLSYYYYPTELEAFTYAEMYLRKEKLHEDVKAYQKQKRKLAILHNTFYAIVLLLLGIIIGTKLIN